MDFPKETEKQESFQKMFNIVKEWAAHNRFETKDSYIMELVHTFYFSIHGLDDRDKITPEVLVNLFQWAVEVRDQYKDHKLEDKVIFERYQHVAKTICQRCQ